MSREEEVTSEINFSAKTVAVEGRKKTCIFVVEAICVVSIRTCARALKIIGFACNESVVTGRRCVCKCVREGGRAGGREGSD